MDSGIELSYEEAESHGSRLSIPLQLAYGVGHVFNDICSSMWFSYILLFLNLVIQFENWQAGLILLIGQLSDAIANPIIGYLSDKTTDGFCGYGKRKTWHLLGTIILVVTFPFTFLPCLGCFDSNKLIKLTYYSIFAVVFQFGWAAVQNSHLSLIPELSDTETDRTKLALARYCFTVISNLMVYIVSWISFGINGNNSKPISLYDGYKFQNIMLFGTFMGIFTSIIFHIFVKERKNIVEKTYSNNNNNNKEFKKKLSICEIMKDIKYYQTSVLYMSTMLFVNMGQVFIPVYLHETLKMNASSLAVIPLVIYIGSLAAALIVKKLNVRFGRKISYIIGSATGLSGCLWIHFRSQYSQFVLYEVYIVAAIFGVANCILQVTNLGITSDVVDSEASNGAFIYGLMTLADKLSSGIAVFVIENLRNYYQTDAFYQYVITSVCGSSVILATVSVIFLVKGNNKKKIEYIPIP